MNNKSKTSVFRIVDAAQNRAAEGLRVVEDFARMFKQDANLARELKKLRHEIAETLAPLKSSFLLRARDPASDVGTTISTPSEFERTDWTDILRANFSRVLQSLRTMEEYSKLFERGCELEAGQSMPQQLEQLRYRTYALEKAIVNCIDVSEEISEVAVYVLIDARQSTGDFEPLIRSLIAAEVKWIQLRDKSLDDQTLLKVGHWLTEWTKDTNTRWIMNDRADLAVLAGAAGVHVGQEDLTVHEARQIVGPEKIIGVSTHNIEQARQAELAGANYIGVGPVFPSQTKAFEQFVPAEFVKGVADEIVVPAFAIGGIDESNVAELADLGITRVAISKAIMDSGDPGQSVSQIKASLRSAISQTPTESV